MAFKDWTRIFRRSENLGESREDAESSQVAVDQENEDRGTELSRKAVIKELEQGFHHVGRVVEQLDHHLTSTNRLLESVANEQERLPALMNELTAAASASRKAHETLSQEIGRRDEANQRLLATLQQLSDGLDVERDHHRAQLALVMRLQRGGRRVLAFLLFFSFLAIAVLMALLLILALRPDIIGNASIPGLTDNHAAGASTEQSMREGGEQEAHGDGAETSRIRAIHDARDSTDPDIRRLAEDYVESRPSPSNE
ncbi:MAG: hypothetical protein EA401_05775 [Planctomycetota bacterium]|nr:MAG: hypothetical protein EA401_05775 [Planctomycetota bacterium]